MMSDSNVIIEGAVKHRDGKKWKTRWCVLSKLSPVADQLQLQLYKDIKDKQKQNLPKASLSLHDFIGEESGFTLDKESYTLSLICMELVVTLAFDNRERLIQWQVKVASNLGEDHQWVVQITTTPARSRLVPGPSRLHLLDKTFCLASGIPPRLFHCWHVPDLRKFGVLEGKFGFEGGSRCGRGEGVHVLVTTQADEIAAAFQMAAEGKLERKTRPLLRNHSALESPRRCFMSQMDGLGRASEGLKSVESCYSVASSSGDSSDSFKNRGAFPVWSSAESGSWDGISVTTDRPWTPVCCKCSVQEFSPSWTMTPSLCGDMAPVYDTPRSVLCRCQCSLKRSLKKSYSSHHVRVKQVPKQRNTLANYSVPKSLQMVNSALSEDCYSVPPPAPSRPVIPDPSSLYDVPRNVHPHRKSGQVNYANLSFERCSQCDVLECGEYLMMEPVKGGSLVPRKLHFGPPRAPSGQPEGRSASADRLRSHADSVESLADSDVVLDLDEETPPPVSLEQATVVTLRRSCSVPSRTAQRDSADSSDSGVWSAPGGHREVTLSYHASLPRRVARREADSSKVGTVRRRKVDGTSRRLKQLMDNRSSSSGASDLSDYMDTLSVYSLSSGDDRGQSHWLLSTLKPRSGQEYQQFNRDILEV